MASTDKFESENMATNLDCPSEWDGEVIPDWAKDYFADDESWTPSGRVVRKTIFALTQWYVSTTPGRHFKPSAIRKLHGDRFSEGKYQRYLKEFSEAGLYERDPVEQGHYRIPVEKELGEVFQAENPPVRLNHDSSKKTTTEDSHTDTPSVSSGQSMSVSYESPMQNGIA